MSHQTILASFFILCGLLAQQSIPAGQLHVGGATVNITPDQPVLLEGSFRIRISKSIAVPCSATALVIERRDGDRSLEQAVYVSCDLVAIRAGDHPYADLYAPVRDALKGRIPDEVLGKIILNATHTHTAPVTTEGKFEIPPGLDVMRPGEYATFLVAQISDAIVQAWEKREPARVAWGLGHAVLAHNRRSTYADGSAAMYGKTDRADFRGLEAGEDHGIEILYFWDEHGKPLATAINVACPAQAVEGGNAVHADFWQPVREGLRKKYGEHLQVLGWIGASGDQGPRPTYRQRAENRMRTLRGLDAPQLAASRLIATWEDVYQVVREDQHADAILEHRVETVRLPYQKLTKEDADRARKNLAQNNAAKGLFNGWWYTSVVERYEQQQQQKEWPHYEMELHAVRLGDVAIVTNDFELFTDYGVQMKARSPALQTFVIQLCGPATYLPTQRAVEGGGYSAIPESNIVGPEGGQVLVDETVKLVKALWEAPSSPADRMKEQSQPSGGTKR